MNNAALFTTLPRHESPRAIPDEGFDRVMAVNVRAIYRCTVECLPLMPRHQGGRVINISSGLAFKGAPGLMHYIVVCSIAWLCCSSAHSPLATILAPLLQRGTWPARRMGAILSCWP